MAKSHLHPIKTSKGISYGGEGGVIESKCSIKKALGNLFLLNNGEKQYSKQRSILSANVREEQMRKINNRKS